MSEEQKFSFSTTLIIGLGGVGCSITSQIYKKFIDGNPTDLEKRNVICLCLDTDAGDVKKNKAILPENWVVKTSSDLSCTIRDYINNIKKETHVLDWFDTRSQYIMDMSLNEGAGQVRMASRLALMSAITEGKLSAIDWSISNLLELDPDRHTGNQINVHIICSLAGGTGAGSFLQTAYYVKNALKKKGVGAPKVNGYFVLADVLCEDRQIGFEDTQKENTRSNTYACMKELNAFIHKEDIKVVKPLELEYRRDQEDISLPNETPYDLCYLIDHVGAKGENLRSSQFYYEQVRDFVFLTAFSPIGDRQRSSAINNIRTLIEEQGESRFNAIGVSKLVYPVDDLFDYFATQRVVDNLRDTWLSIDKSFEELMNEYKQKVLEGVPAQEPDRGEHFMSQVKHLANNGSGWEKTEFKAILNSTQVFDKESNDSIPISTKATDYIAGVENYVQSVISQSDRLAELREPCEEEFNYQVNNQVNDVNVVDRVEKALDEYKKYATRFIENQKAITIKECFLKDAEFGEPRVSPDPNATQHHLNTHILEKDHEMHPIAVRYFLYEVMQYINERLIGYKLANDGLWKQINEDYKRAFDIIDEKTGTDEDYVETAKDKIDIVYQKNKAFFKRTWAKITSQRPVADCKKDYRKKATIQMEAIGQYINDRLMELVFEGLKVQIGRLIEESENFFSRLPDTLRGLQNQCDALLNKHEGVAHPSITYVLAEKTFKVAIYLGEIVKSDTPFFPEDMSRKIYCTMFDNTKDALDSRDSVSEALAKISKKAVDVEAKRAAQIAADKKIFDEVLATQRASIMEKNKGYSEMNVIKALKKEAELQKKIDSTVVESEYIQKKFERFRDKAQIMGANNIDQKRFINSWGLNPECLGSATITTKEKADLFGDTSVTATPGNSATIEQNAFFSKYEIIRANSVHLLTLEDNFKGFDSSRTNPGVYYKAYQDVLDKVMNMPSKSKMDEGRKKKKEAYSPHLDKKWHLPAYMPNIGLTVDDVLKDIFSALYFGMLFKCFSVRKDGGEEYWYFMGKQGDYVRDLDNYMIGMKGKSLGFGLSLLFEKGLVNNQKMVNEIDAYIENQWEKAIEAWQNTESEDLAKMKEQEIVKLMREFDYNCINPSWTNTNNWFSFLSSTKKGSMLADNMNRLKNIFFDDVINRLIATFGRSSNTEELCEYVFDAIGDATFKEEAKKRVELFAENHRFEPK